MGQVTVYCSKEDVQRWVKRVQFTDSTKVTPSDVDHYIQLVSNIVDGELRKLGITLPVSSSAKVSMEYLKTLVSIEAASIAESNVYFAGNKNESTHGKYLHDRYLELLLNMQTNASTVLSDVVTGSITQMKSNTEDMNVGNSKEGDEIFTKKHIDDFRDNNKVYSPSEKTSTSESITGRIDRERI